MFPWGEFVRTLRSERFADVTQEQLARMIGVSVSSVVKWEAGAVRPQSRNRWALRRLACRVGYVRQMWPSGGPIAFWRGPPEDGDSRR